MKGARLDVGGAIGSLLMILIGSAILINFVLELGTTLVNTFTTLATNWTAMGGLYSVGAIVMPYIPFAILFGTVAVFLGVGLSKLKDSLTGI